MRDNADRRDDEEPLDARLPIDAIGRVDIPALLAQLREERTDHLIQIVTRSTTEADSPDWRR